MAYTTFITVNKKSVKIEISEEAHKEHVSKMRYVMRMQDKKVDDYYRDLKMRGTCPQCHLVLPLTKYCSNCQTKYN